MACSVLGSVVTGDCGVNMSSVDPTVLVSSTENLLVGQGMDFTIDQHKKPLWFLLPFAESQGSIAAATASATMPLMSTSLGLAE